MSSQREKLLNAIRERNTSYRACQSVTEENHRLAQEVDRLREQLHRLEQVALAASCRARRVGAHSDASDEGGAFRNDALRLSPSLWPRLAFGALRRLSPSDSVDFCSAVEDVCSTAKDWTEDVTTAHASAKTHHIAFDASTEQTAVATAGQAQSAARHEILPTAGAAGGKQTMTLEDVVNQFSTHIVRGMLASNGKVDLGRLRTHEESFRRILLEVCWHGAASSIPVSSDLAEEDRKRSANMPPYMRILMSEELIETHDKLALAEQAVFASQTELFEAYSKLAANGKEVAALRKQLVAVQGDLVKAQKELSKEVAFFRQVQEENRVQAAIIKSHSPHVQQLSEEIRALTDDRTALCRQVWDLEQLVLLMREAQVAQAHCLSSLTKLAYTAADRLTVVMDKRHRETCALHALLSLAVSAAPPSPDEFDEFAHADAQHAARLWADEQPQDADHAERLRTDARAHPSAPQDVTHTPQDSDSAEQHAVDARRKGLALNTALGGAGGMQGWAREALEEAAADLHRMVQDVEQVPMCQQIQLADI
jgi:hypothetical protein